MCLLFGLVLQLVDLLCTEKIRVFVVMLTRRYNIGLHELNIYRVAFKAGQTPNVCYSAYAEPTRLSIRSQLWFKSLVHTNMLIFTAVFFSQSWDGKLFFDQVLWAFLIWKFFSRFYWNLIIAFVFMMCFKKLCYFLKHYFQN